MNKSASIGKRRGGAAPTEKALVVRLLKSLRAGRDLRRQKVRRVKSALRRQEYVNALKLEVAADRLAGELAGDT